MILSGFVKLLKNIFFLNPSLKQQKPHKPGAFLLVNLLRNF